MQDDPEFAAFYARWPRKIARADALKAWAQTRAARPPLLELLRAVDRLMSYRAQLAARRDFVPSLPYPATWLRGLRWQDEFDAPAAMPSGPTEADLQWNAVREALRFDDPRRLTNPRTRYAIDTIGWMVLQGMRTSDVPHQAREFARLFNSAPLVQRAQVHAFPTRKVANG